MKSKKAFTLLEILTVMTIITLILGSVFLFFNSSKSSMEKTLVDTKLKLRVELLKKLMSKDMANFSVPMKISPDSYEKGDANKYPLIYKTGWIEDGLILMFPTNISCKYGFDDPSDNRKGQLFINILVLKNRKLFYEKRLVEYDKNANLDKLPYSKTAGNLVKSTFIVKNCKVKIDGDLSNGKIFSISFKIKVRSQNGRWIDKLFKEKFLSRALVVKTL